MAKKDKSAKEPGRIKQLWQIFQLTRKSDKLLLPILALTMVVPIVVGIVAANLISGGSVLTLILYITTGILLAVLLTLVVLGQRAERTAYQQIAGQPGAVGAVLRPPAGDVQVVEGYCATVPPHVVDRKHPTSCLPVDCATGLGVAALKGDGRSDAEGRFAPCRGGLVPLGLARVRG